MPGLIVPTHAIVIHGKVERVEMKVGANATPAKMLPGTLVILDTTENEVMEAGAAAHGILGIIDVDAEHDIGDPYDNGLGTVGDNVPIIVPQSSAFVALRLLASEDIIQGDTLVSSTDGVVAEAAVAALGSQGDIVGMAWDTSASVAAEVRIIVLWCYTPEGKAIT